MLVWHLVRSTGLSAAACLRREAARCGAVLGKMPMLVAQGLGCPLFIMIKEATPVLACELLAG